MPFGLLLLLVFSVAASLSVAVPAAAAETLSPQAVRWNDEGIRLAEAGKHLEAIEAFRNALKEAPTDDTIMRNLALSRSNLSVWLLGRGEADRAAHQAEEARKLLPKDPIVLLNLAACREEQGYPHDAALLVAEARENGTREPLAYERWGMVLYREGRLEDAIAEWETAVRLGSRSSKLHSRLDRAKKALAVEQTLSRQHSSHFTVLHDATQTVLASHVLRTLEEAHRVVSADIQSAITRPLKVVLLSQEAFRASTGAHQWVAGLFDGQIRLPIKGVGTKQEELLKRARHEYVHAALAPLGRRAPSWLHEGLAQLHEGRDVRASAGRVRIVKGLDYAQLIKPFASTADEGVARLQYDTSLAFVEWLRRGERGTSFRAALARLYEGERLEPSFQQAYDVSIAQLYASFQKSVRSR